MIQKPELSILDRRAQIISRIDNAAISRGLSPTDITLTAVSKVQPEERVDAMLALGQRIFGENRVQEAQGRWEKRRAQFPDLQLRLIGPLQTNKVADAVALFDTIETVDRLKLAQYLAKEMKKQERDIELFVQINTGAEPQKAGVLPADADEFLRDIRERFHLKIAGLMCIPPVGEPAGPHFALLRKIAKRNGIDKLSMGMSDDFETAIGFGATHIRVGSALFGPRI